MATLVPPKYKISVVNLMRGIRVIRYSERNIR